LVHRRLQQLSEQDLGQQLWFIRAALATLARGPEPAAHPAARPAERERLLAAARSVGDHLEALALRGTQDASWIGLTLTQQRHWALTPLGVDLYGGLPGVALFLAHLGALTGQARYTTLAQAALTGLRCQVERAQDLITSVGGFEGWGGILYALTHLGVLWDD